MTKILAFIAVAALSLSASMAEAAKKKPPEVSATSYSARSSDPKKAGYGRGMRARWGSGCKMSGRC
jgi:hypothetical protein